MDMLLSELKEVLFGPFEESIRSDESTTLFASRVDELARNVARNLGSRQEIVQHTGTAEGDDVWTRLGRYWNRLGEELDPTGTGSTKRISEDRAIDLALMLAKLERNLIAGLSIHQEKALSHEPAIRLVIFQITTFARIEDPRFYRLQAMMAQLLSNLISPAPDAPNESSTDRLLNIYLSGQRGDDVVIRLLDSQETSINIPVLHMLNNITRESPDRQQRLISGVGIQWVSRVLGRMEDWLEPGDARFDLACQLFTKFIGSGLHASLIHALNPPSSTSEPITPAQTALLKLLDSYLSSDHENPSSDTNEFLLPTLDRLSTYAVSSLSSGLDDARLPKVLEALVLVVESLGSIGLACQARRDRREAAGTEEKIVAAMKEGGDVINHIVDLLKGLHAFMPRIRPSPANPVSNEAPTERSLGGIKISLVRLLGVLSFEDTAVGDQVRERGGVELVLSMTEVDELNPYLREHALFTIRNLMRDNLANQAVVKEMDPVGVVSDSGEVLPLPEKLKKQTAQLEEL